MTPTWGNTRVERVLRGQSKRLQLRSVATCTHNGRERGLLLRLAARLNAAFVEPFREFDEGHPEGDAPRPNLDDV